MTGFDYQNLLVDIATEVERLYGQGKVAAYIPELENIDPKQFAMTLTFLDQDKYSTGVSQQRFSIQSISKVFTLMLAVSEIGEKVYQRVGVEPSGDPFNSLVQLEHEKGLPRNPFINAGAIVVSDVLLSIYDDPLKQLLNFVHDISGSDQVYFDKAVAKSEQLTGHRNYALANFLKSFDRIENPIEDVLDVYFHQCALAMTCEELSAAFLLLANHGKSVFSSNAYLTPSQAKRINSIMQTCGFYDQAGEFTFRVGLPGKSGVGGGIAAIKPGEFSIAVWSPELNQYGNSVLGMKALELFTTATGKSIF